MDKDSPFVDKVVTKCMEDNLNVKDKQVQDLLRSGVSARLRKALKRKWSNLVSAFRGKLKECECFRLFQLSHCNNAKPTNTFPFAGESQG